jgi:hypothetical protein
MPAYPHTHTQAYSCVLPYKPHCRVRKKACVGIREGKGKHACRQPHTHQTASYKGTRKKKKRKPLSIKDFRHPRKILRLKLTKKLKTNLQPH